MVYPSCSTQLATIFRDWHCLHWCSPPPPTTLNFVWWRLTYLAQLFQFLSLHTQIFIDSYAPSWKRLRKARFTSNYTNVCSQCGNCFMSPFWRSEFIKMASKLICGPVAHTFWIFCWNTPIKVRAYNKISTNFYTPSEAALMTTGTRQNPGVM